MKKIIETLVGLSIDWLFFLNFITLGILLYYWGSVGLAFGASAWIAFKFWIGSIVIALGIIIGSIWVSFVAEGKKWRV